ncbi:MAG: ATP-binding protein [Cystobacterineae bacterium]|nr:ATP-binding protein [Cystobacterineae bacterium]
MEKTTRRFFQLGSEALTEVFLEASLEFGRQLADAAMSEAEVVEVFGKVLETHCPSLWFCICVVDFKSAEFTSQAKRGPLLPNSPGAWALPEAMASSLRLKNIQLPPKLKVVAQESMLFEGSAFKLSLPLCAAQQFLGLFRLESAWPKENFGADIVRLLELLSHQLAMAIGRAKATAELAFNRCFFEEILENTHALVGMVDSSSCLKVYNKAFSALTGFAREEILGRSLFSLIPKVEYLKLTRVMSEVLKGKRIPHFETQILTRDEKLIRVGMMALAVRSTRGEVEGMLFIGYDLTRIRSLESHIVQAEKLTSLGKLAADIVHEINNPMTAVLTYTDALLKRAMLRPNGQADVEKFQRIIESGERILKFTRSLSSYGKPSEEIAEALELRVVLEKAVSLCEHSLQAAHVSVACEYQAMPPLWGIRQNLIQVFINLLLNACQVTPPGQTLKLETELEGNVAKISVQDSGPGIPPELLGKIFDPYFTTREKGTGLGLSIVRTLVENHGGSIEVTTELNVGSCFIVRLPFLQAQPATKA